MNIVRRIRDVMPSWTFMVRWKLQDWYGVPLSRYSKEPDGMIADFPNILRKAMAERRKIQLIFKDEEQLIAFLADTNPALEPLRGFVRMTRSYGAYMAVTAEELKTMLGIEEVTDRNHWYLSFGATHVPATAEDNLIYRSAVMRKPLPDWELKKVLTNPGASYRFQLLLNYWAAMDDIAARRPQSLIPGIPVTAQWHDDLIMFGADINAPDKTVMMVPDDETIPVLMDHELHNPEGDDSYESEPWTKGKTATLYVLEEPRLSWVKPWETETVSNLAQRRPPLDVIAAAGD